MKENLSSNEVKEVSDQELIDALRDRGPEHPLTKELLRDWCIQEEGKVEHGSFEERVHFELKRARLYLAAGYGEESYECYQDAFTIAENAGLDVLCQEINNEVAMIEAQ